VLEKKMRNSREEREKGREIETVKKKMRNREGDDFCFSFFLN